MADPAQYEALLNNIFRLVDDAELLLEAGRFASANALAIFALEEAGKYTAFMNAEQPPKKAKMHLFRQEVMGKYFKSSAIFEAFARDMDGMLEDLKKKSRESYEQAVAMPRPELIRLTMGWVCSDPDFDLRRFLRRVIGEDPSLTFTEEAKAGNYHRERQQSIHADYDDDGRLTSDPSAITQEQATRSVEMAAWAAELQKFWLTNQEHDSASE